MNEAERNSSGVSVADAVSVAALLVLLALTPTQYARSVAKLYIAYADLLVFLLFGVIFVAALSRRRLGDLPWPPAAAWAFVLVAAASALNSTGVVTGLSEASSWLRAPLEMETVRDALAEGVQIIGYVICAFVVFRVLIADQRRLRLTVATVLVMTAVVVAYGLAEYALLANGASVSATFGTANVYSGFLAMALPLVLACALSCEDRRLRVGLTVLIVAGLTTMLGPGGLVGGLVGLLYVGYRHSARIGGALAVGLVAMLALLSFAGTRSYTQGIRPFLGIFDDEGDLRKQYLEWQAALDMTEDNPALGVGAGNYQLNIGVYYGSLPNKLKMPHDWNNLYLVLASSMGFLGLAAFINMLWRFFGTAEAVVRLRGVESTCPSAPMLALGIQGAILGFAVTSVFHSLWVRGTGPFLILLCAIAVILQAECAPPASRADDDGARDN